MLLFMLKALKEPFGEIEEAEPITILEAVQP
jgi:hypothetical protein